MEEGVFVQQVNVVDVVEQVVFLEESERLIPHANEAIHPLDPLDAAAEEPGGEPQEQPAIEAARNELLQGACGAGSWLNTGHPT